jgi:hypothetical protein
VTKTHIKMGLSNSRLAARNDLNSLIQLVQTVQDLTQEPYHGSLNAPSLLAYLWTQLRVAMRGCAEQHFISQFSSIQQGELCLTSAKLALQQEQPSLQVSEEFMPAPSPILVQLTSDTEQPMAVIMGAGAQQGMGVGIVSKQGIIPTQPFAVPAESNVALAVHPELVYNLQNLPLSKTNPKLLASKAQILARQTSRFTPAVVHSHETQRLVPLVLVPSLMTNPARGATIQPPSTTAPPMPPLPPLTQESLQKEKEAVEEEFPVEFAQSEEEEEEELPEFEEEQAPVAVIESVQQPPRSIVGPVPTAPRLPSSFRQTTQQPQRPPVFPRPPLIAAPRQVTGLKTQLRRALQPRREALFVPGEEEELAEEHADFDFYRRQHLPSHYPSFARKR